MGVETWIYSRRFSFFLIHLESIRLFLPSSRSSSVINLVYHSFECLYGNTVLFSAFSSAESCQITGFLVHTLGDDSIFLGYPGDVRIRGNAEVAGWLQERVSTNCTSGYSNTYAEHARARARAARKGLHHCRGKELCDVAMVTLTAATASSRPREPQLTIRVKTPSRHTLKDKQKERFCNKVQTRSDWSN